MSKKPIILAKFTKKQICHNCFSIVSWDDPSDEFIFLNKKKVYCPECGNMLDADLDAVEINVVGSQSGQIDIDDLLDYDFIGNDEAHKHEDFSTYLQNNVTNQGGLQVVLNKDVVFNKRIDKFDKYNCSIDLNDHKMTIDGNAGLQTRSINQHLQLANGTISRNSTVSTGTGHFIANYGGVCVLKNMNISTSSGVVQSSSPDSANPSQLLITNCTFESLNNTTYESVNTVNIFNGSVATIENSIIKSKHSTAIAISNGTNGASVTINNSTVQGAEQSSSFKYHPGLKTHDQNGTGVNNTIITINDSQIRSNKGPGIYLYGKNNQVIINGNSTVYGSGVNGSQYIYYSRQDKVSLNNNCGIAQTIREDNQTDVSKIIVNGGVITSENDATGNPRSINIIRPTGSTLSPNVTVNGGTLIPSETKEDAQ